MIKYILPAFLALGICFPIVAQAQNTDSLVAYYNRQADLYLVKSVLLRNFFSVDKDGIAMYASPARKTNKQPEIKIGWDELHTFKKIIKYADRNFQYKMYQAKGTAPFTPTVIDVVNILEQNHQLLPIVTDKPLAGLKIAIDPGHIAGDFHTAVAESRFIDMKTSTGKPIRFFEGELTLTTALILKDSLQKAGAEVFLSREKPNQSANGKFFEDWLKTDLKAMLRRKGMDEAQITAFIQNTPKHEVYHDYFLNMDLDARADAINYFKPHFTIVIHFNADANNLGWRKPTLANYNLVFVPGSFMHNELFSEMTRFDFLRILLSDYLPESAKLSGFILNEFDEGLDVPPVQSYEEPYYLRNNSMKVTEGVYARNLRLCRLLNTPICYGESLLQDNEAELLALSKNDYKKGVYAPRIVQVAGAYYRGVLRYAGYLKQKERGTDVLQLAGREGRSGRAE